MQKIVFSSPFFRKTWMELPMVAAEVEMRTGTGNILLVEDEDVLNSTSELLQQFGYQVVEFNSAVDALSYPSTIPGSFQIMRTDLTKPTMKGVELSKEVHKTKAGPADSPLSRIQRSD